MNGRDSWAPEHSLPVAVTVSLTVREGERLASLAMRYGTTPEHIARAFVCDWIDAEPSALRERLAYLERGRP